MKKRKNNTDFKKKNIYFVYLDLNFWLLGQLFTICIPKDYC